MKRRRRFTHERKGNGTFVLNITSMTDMFTIMLVFLLQTFSTSEVELIPAKGIRLPSSNTQNNPINGIKVSITKESLYIDDKPIATVRNLDFEQKDIDQKDPNYIPSLFDSLDQIAKKSGNPAVKEGRILLQADEALPYQTLRRVMYTASMAGFPQLKLVTVVGD